jgi:hypothetical protein
MFPFMRIDHVIYGTSDLDRAAARLEAILAVRAVRGGRHDGVGTHNRIVPLGDGTFIEILAIADPAEAARSTLGAALQAAIASGDRLLAWAVAVDNVASVAARLGTSISTVGRQAQTARLTGVMESLADPYLPFFIERPAEVISRPTSRTTIAWIEVTGNEADSSNGSAPNYPRYGSWPAPPACAPSRSAIAS